LDGSELERAISQAVSTETEIVCGDESQALLFELHPAPHDSVVATSAAAATLRGRIRNRVARKFV
jgi:hypothetical protein